MLPPHANRCACQPALCHQLPVASSPCCTGSHVVVLWLSNRRRFYCCPHSWARSAACGCLQVWQSDRGRDRVFHEVETRAQQVGSCCAAFVLACACTRYVLCRCRVGAQTAVAVCPPTHPPTHPYSPQSRTHPPTHPLNTNHETLPTQTTTTTTPTQVSVLLCSVGSILVHAGFMVYAIVNRDPTFGPLANQPNIWLLATSWVPNLLPLSLLVAWAWKVESPQQSSSHKRLNVDSVWNHQLRHLLEGGTEEDRSNFAGHPMVNVSSDDHVGAVSFQAIAAHDDLVGFGGVGGGGGSMGSGIGGDGSNSNNNSYSRLRGGPSGGGGGGGSYGSFDTDLLYAISSISGSTEGQLAAHARAQEFARQQQPHQHGGATDNSWAAGSPMTSSAASSPMSSFVRLSSSAPDARGILGLMAAHQQQQLLLQQQQQQQQPGARGSAAFIRNAVVNTTATGGGGKQQHQLGLAAAAKFLGRQGVQAKKTAAMLTQATYVANWTSLLGPSVEGFAAVRPSTDPSLSASRDEGTLWVSVSCGACVHACVRACVRTCVCACVRTCVRACVRACAWRGIEAWRRRRVSECMTVRFTGHVLLAPPAPPPPWGSSQWRRRL
jgi:hypothetical protein